MLDLQLSLQIGSALSNSMLSVAHAVFAHPGAVRIGSGRHGYLLRRLYGRRYSVLCNVISRNLDLISRDLILPISSRLRRDYKEIVGDSGLVLILPATF